MNWEIFYLICFGTGLALCLLSFLGGLHIHVGHVHVGHGNCAHTGFSYLNGFTFMAFLCMFGGTGYLLTHYRSMLVPAVLIIAATAGLAAAGTISFFLVKVLLPRERLLLPEDTEMRGVIARVSSTIHATGTGEIIFSLNGGRKGAAARTEDGSPVQRNQQVLVLRYERGIAYVRPWTDMDELEQPRA